MCGGNKGQSTSNQTQSYSPDPQARGYITGALDRAQSVANLPFNVPVAPVAGFAGDQNAAFQGVRNAQGMAQPYFSQAADLYRQGASGSNISNFFNPFASAVTDNLKDIFGSQMSQTTGKLIGQAGGVGGDRIAVGQSELAKQQGLAAGQTLASLYQPALQAAQSAAFNGAQGLGNVGQASQNAQLQGANALMGTGGLQQQLAQAQMNAPYQHAVAQAAFPYQQSQFLSGAVGALAPGLGGTTQGQTTSTPAQPSIWSQLLGAGTAAIGGLGGSGAFGSNGWLTGSQPTGYQSYGGITYPQFASGGAVSDDPIDIAANPFIPQSQLVPIKPNVPQLQQPQSGSGGSGKGGGLGDMIGTVAKVLPFFLATGGRVNPFASFADGGGIDDRFDAVREAIASGDFDPQGMNSTTFEPSREMAQANAVPLPAERPETALPRTESPALAYAPEAEAPQPAGRSGLPPEIAAGRSAPSRDSFLDSPWAGLMAAGLGIMGGTSPFAGVNIGQGGMQGLKTLQQQRENAQKDQTIAQATQRLDQEAKHHWDQYNLMTPFQRESLKLKEAENKQSGDHVLDDESARLAAQVYVRSGTMPALGFGDVGNQNRAKVWQFVKQITKEQGLTGEHLATNKLEYVGETSGARARGTREANLDVILRATEAAIPAALEASKEVARTGWVPLNKIIQRGQVMASDPKLRKFGMANLQLAEHWARAMNPTGVMRESDRDMALGFLSTADSETTYEAAVQQLQKQIKNEIAAVRSGKAGASPSAPSGAAAGPARVNSIEEARKLPKGTRFIDPNGVERMVP